MTTSGRIIEEGTREDFKRCLLREVSPLPDVGEVYRFRWDNYRSLWVVGQVRDMRTYWDMRLYNLADRVQQLILPLTLTTWLLRCANGDSRYQFFYDDTRKNY